MKARIPITIEVEITHILVTLPVRYEEEDIPNDFPLRKGDVWSAKIEIDTGKILGWPEGQAGEIDTMKVCDSGSYRLLDANGCIVANIEQDYVPHGVIPGDSGDYVSLKINEAGIITNWPKRPDIREFLKGDGDDD